MRHGYLKLANIYVDSYCACYNGYKPNSKKIRWKMAVLAPEPTWAHMDPPIVPIQNQQILMQILTLHAMIGLQTKFEAI